VLDIRARKKVSRAVDPLARLLVRSGLSPTAVTFAGLGISIVGSALIALGFLAAGAAVLGTGAALDILDGVLARMTGRETVRGAFLDSLTDRVGEVAMWTGLAFYLGRRSEAMLVMLSLVALAGSLLIPYLRAKAEAEGVEGKGGLMGRAERLLLFCWGVGIAGLGLPVLASTIWALAGLTWLTVVQRLWRTWVLLGE
jgi:CDP-diacylglycerol--glycerol-3-phosphate 3-phosphatidyltransferase